jgi:hypothetical protein
MSSTQPMASTRRRAISGMASHRQGGAAPDPERPPAATVETPTADQETTRPVSPPVDPDGSGGSATPSASTTTGTDRPMASSPASAGPERWAARDYASTRLVNFRIPVDIHDRYRQLIRDVEERYPRLRRPSLTEFVIALLEEGPRAVDEVAETIRRKRAAEHEQEL